ncbi:MAG: hypothetical protein QHH14_12860 [Clostridiales bacterium]|nr:hypothetical protein [Clostridiales bacterium]
MKKSCALVLSFCLLLGAASVPAFAWGAATHAYIAGKLGKIWPLMNANERYGIMAADLFNYDFQYYFNSTVKLYTHGGPGAEGFMGVWANARWWGYQKSLAFGFVAHNEVWGCDYTAHVRGLTYGQGVGYVVAKATELMPDLAALLGSHGFSLDDPVLLEVCHNLVEAAGDILILRADPTIGEKIISACLLRSNDFPGLLASAMGPAWKDAVIAAEKEFRRTMILYGAALTQGQEPAVKAFAEHLAQLGVELIKFLGGPDIPLDLAKGLAESGIRQALNLCRSDYLPEVNATVSFVKANLAAHGVWY